MRTSSFSESTLNDLLERNYSLESIKHGDGELNSRDLFSLLSLLPTHLQQRPHHPLLVQLKSLGLLRLLELLVGLIGHLHHLSLSSVVDAELHHFLGLQAAGA